MIKLLYLLSFCICSGQLRTQKLKSPLLRIQGSKVLLLKPRVDLYIAMHVPPTARNVFLAYLNHSGLFTFIKKKSRLFPVSAVACVGSCVDPQNKTGHPACCLRQLMQVSVLSARGI